MQDNWRKIAISLILQPACEAKKEESAVNRYRLTDATFCKHQPA
jgi:hypothetical protein